MRIEEGKTGKRKGKLHFLYKNQRPKFPYENSETVKVKFYNNMPVFHN